MALFTLEDLATFLQVDLDTASATRARSQAETYLRAHLPVELTRETRTHTERVPRACTAVLLRGPIVSVTTVTVDGTELAAGDWEQTRRGLTCADGFGQYLPDGQAWCELSVTYEGGFDTVPSDLTDWGLWLAAAAYTRAPGGAVQQQAIGGVSASYGSPVMAEAMRLPGDVLRALQRTYGRATPTAAGSVPIR